MISPLFSLQGNNNLRLAARFFLELWRLKKTLAWL